MLVIARDLSWFLKGSQRTSSRAWHPQLVDPLLSIARMARATLGLRDVRFWARAVLLQVDRLNEELHQIGERLLAGDKGGTYAFQVQWESDRHHLVVAADHLRRATLRTGPLKKQLRLSDGVARAVSVMRDVYEHWENHEAAFATPPAEATKAAARFVAEWPGAKPNSTSWNEEDGMRIGSLDVRALVDDIFRIREVLYEVGIIPPGGDEI